MGLEKVFEESLLVDQTIRDNQPFRALPQNFEKLLLASSYLSATPSARVEQLDSHWTDFHDI
jgi:hypothetical protein